MKTLICVLVIVVASESSAQPGLTPELSADSMRILETGEVSEMQQYGGMLSAVFFGFGTGQAIQGRWRDTGWIFTLGGTASVGAMVYGIAAGQSCTTTCPLDATLFVGGLLGAGVFHWWGVVDAIVGPRRHNRRLRELNLRLSTPRAGERGAVAGLSLQF